MRLFVIIAIRLSSSATVGQVQSDINRSIIRRGKYSPQEETQW